MVSNVKTLDPVQGLVDYVNDIKPYHTKVIESLVEYVGTEIIDVSVLELFMMDINLIYSHDSQYKQTYIAAGNELTSGITTTLPTITNIKYRIVYDYTVSPIEPVYVGSPQTPLTERYYDFYGTFVYLNGVLLTEGMGGSPLTGDYYFVGTNKIMFLNEFNANDLIEIYTNTQNKNVPLSCEGGGFGTLAFDDPDAFPVISPDPLLRFHEFPALQSTSFIVAGDQRKYFDSSSDLTFKIASYIEDRIINVVASTGSPAINNGTFELLGDRTLTFPINTVFIVTGSLDNDNAYRVSQNATFDGTTTTITVDQQSVPSNSTSGFIKTIDSANSGDFLVASSIYTPVSTRSIAYTTVYITGLVLSPDMLVVEDNQRYISIVSIGAIGYKKILSYSNALRYYNTATPEILQRPNEGVVYSKIVGLSQGSPSYFLLEDNYENSNLAVGDSFSVVNSTDNNTSYTINSIAYSFDAGVGADVTRIGVDLIHSSDADGFAELTIPSNVFIVDGNYTSFFKQGSNIKVITGSQVGVYTILYSRFVNDETQIRVLEDIIDHTRGALIVSTTSTPDGFLVTGNLTTTYKQDSQFNLVLSLHNDGQYTVASDSTYDSGTNLTTILTTETFDLADTSGEIHKFVAGSLKFVSPGYGESADICEAMPETLVFVNIADKLYIDNYGIWTSDDVVAYGTGGDGLGFELPAVTIMTALEPSVLISDTPPLTPVENMLWFDSSANNEVVSGPGVLKIYTTNGSPINSWVSVKGNKAYWVDTDTNYLYYRMVYQYYDPSISDYPIPSLVNNLDTGWVLELTRIPGFNDISAGTSPRNQIDIESFFVVSDENAIVEKTYTLNSNTFTYIGSPVEPDYSVVEIYVNSALASITIDDATTFTVTSPILRVDDFIEVRLFDNTALVSNTFIGAFDTSAAIEETFDMFKGYKFDVQAVDGTNNRIYIVDDGTGTLLDFFTVNALGSPIIDNQIELINTGSPDYNGVYTIIGASTYTGTNYNSVLLSVSESIPSTVGVLDQVPMIPIAQAIYQVWYQYMITDTTANTILLNGDATSDINNGDTIQITYSEGSPTNDGNYTVNGVPTFDGVSTTVTTTETIPNIGSLGWVESV